MTHLFLPIELALLAKEKGFDEPCFAYFYHSEFCYWIKSSGFEYQHCSNSYFNRNEVAAPLYQQIIDWFKEKHKILIAERWDGWEYGADEWGEFIICKTKDDVIKAAFKMI